MEVGNVAAIAQSFGRRGDAVMAMWQARSRSSEHENARASESVSDQNLADHGKSITDAWGRAPDGSTLASSARSAPVTVGDTHFI